MTTVLVVDDSDSIRKFVRIVLEPQGCNVIEAEDGALGMEALRATTEPGVVLLDYHMPNLDGWEVLQQVAASSGPLTEHQYIVITADVSTFPEAYIELLRVVSIRILAKPFQPQELVAAVTQAVERLSAPVPSPVTADAETYRDS
ncbi:MAG: response regulator [Ktedonobacterales bacterium]